MAFSEQDIESGLSGIEADVERYEQDLEGATTRMGALEEALSKLGDDARLYEAVSERAGEAAEEVAEAQRMRDSLVQDLGAFGRQLASQMETLAAERQTLSQLEAIGEDVSAASSVLNERQAWLEACQSRMEAIGERLDAAVEAYDIRGTDAQRDAPLGTESKAEGGKGAAAGGAGNPAEQGFLSDIASDFNLASAEGGIPNPYGDAVPYDIIDWDSPQVDPRVQGVMDLLHQHLRLSMRPTEEDQGVLAITLTLGPSTPQTKGLAWPTDEDLIAEYQLFRNAAVSAGASNADLYAFDNEFARAIMRYQQARDAAQGAGHDGGGPSITPGYGPGVRPSQGMYDAARRRSDPKVVSSPVRGLSHTNEPTHARADGGTVYDSPTTQAARLNWKQGLSSSQFQGTCGLCSVQNVARLAGKSLSEADVVELAKAHGLCCCDPNVSPGERGGTDPADRQRLLSLVGISSSIDHDQSCGHIAELVESGRGVIASVDVRQFWKGALPFDQAGGHAVTITSVERDASGTPVRFHFCDSGLGDADYSVDATQFMVALKVGRGLNVTDDPIR